MTETIDATYNPTNEDVYAKHLAKVNETKQVVAIKDICNDQGMILVKAGTAITSQAADKIVKFKLLQPIEQSVLIEGDIDGSTLYKHTLHLVEKNPVALKIHQQQNLNESLKKLCHFYQTFPILRQKITVLSMQLKKVYTQSLMCAWMSAMIARQMELEPEEQKDLFIAAISHDMGMLHIDEAILNKEEKLTADEWRHIYAHPIIGEKILSGITNISKATVRAVKEHHERCDGTGYPAGKFEKELGKLGQIVAMADSVVAILSRFKPQGRNFRDIIPVIQINSQAHFYGTYEAFVVVLRSAELGEEGVVEPAAMPQFIDTVLLNNMLLSQWLKAAEEPILGLGYKHQNRKLHTIQTVLMNVATAVRGAGILDEGYIRFLELVKKEGLAHAYREIEDVSIMLAEIRYHLEKLARLCKEYIEFVEDPEGDIHEALTTALNNIDNVKQEAADRDPAKFSV